MKNKKERCNCCWKRDADNWIPFSDGETKGICDYCLDIVSAKNDMDALVVSKR